MKPYLFLLVLALTVGVALAAGQPQTYCPVMPDNPVDESSSFVDVNGYRIYICCKGCGKAILADAENYIAQLQAAGIELAKAEAPATE